MFQGQTNTRSNLTSSLAPFPPFPPLPFAEPLLAPPSASFSAFILASSFTIMPLCPTDTYTQWKSVIQMT